MYQKAIQNYIRGPLLQAINANLPDTIGTVEFDSMADTLEFPLPKGFHGLATPYYDDCAGLPVCIQRNGNAEPVFDHLYNYELTMIAEDDAKKWIEIVLIAYEEGNKKSFVDIEADQNRKVFILNVVDEFKKSVEAAMDSGMHKDFADHLDFLEACLGVFIETEQEE
jgi:hypothetical protein